MSASGRDHWDVVLIGSGISCLTAAAILAKKGKSVCVLEKHVKPGGYMHCFRRFQTQFDTGAHYVGALGPGDPFRLLLSYVGAFVEDDFIALDDEAFDELHFPDFQSSFGRGHDAMARRLASQFPGERGAVERYFDIVRQTASSFPTYAFRDDVDEERLAEALTTSLGQLVRSLTADPRLRSVLFAYCALHGVHPDEVPFGLHAVVTDSLLRGAYGFRKGGDRLAERYVAAIEAHGGTVRMRSGVKALEIDRNEVAAVVTDSGERFRASWVISGIHPKATFRLIDDETRRRVLTPAFRERLGSIEESSGIFGVYALCGAPPLRRDRNYYFFSSDDPDALFRPSTQGPTVPLVFAASSDRAGSDSAHGMPLLLHSPSPMAWFEPWRHSRFGKRQPEYDAMKERLAESIIGFVESRRPGVKPSINRYVTSTPLTNMHFNGSEDGSCYGIYHSMANSGARGLGPRTHVRNLLLTGQNCLFPGLMAAAVSGLRTAGHLVGIKGLIREVAQLRGHA